MTKTPSHTLFFWCCLVQSVVIIALAFYAGNEKTEKEKLIKEKEMTSFELMMREAEISRLRAIADTCHGEKK